MSPEKKQQQERQGENSNDTHTKPNESTTPTTPDDDVIDSTGKESKTGSSREDPHPPGELLSTGKHPFKAIEPLLTRFRKEFGHAVIPNALPNHGGSSSAYVHTLTAWAQELRQKYANLSVPSPSAEASPNKEHLEHLATDIGFVFEVTGWHILYAQLVAYAKKHGTTVIPSSYVDYGQTKNRLSSAKGADGDQNVDLSCWTLYQRLAADPAVTCHRLPPDRSCLLDKMGFEWKTYPVYPTVADVLNTDWTSHQQRLERLAMASADATFRELFLSPPAEPYESETAQRPEGTTITTTPLKRGGDGGRDNKIQPLLDRFITQFGHAIIPDTFPKPSPKIPGYVSDLVAWATERRREFAASADPQHRETVEVWARQIGFALQIDGWHLFYVQLVDFSKKHGTTVVPSSYVNYGRQFGTALPSEENVNLSCWSLYQRLARMTPKSPDSQFVDAPYDETKDGSAISSLPEQRIRLLNKVGFEWDTFPTYPKLEDILKTDWKKHQSDLEAVALGNADIIFQTLLQQSAIATSDVGTRGEAGSMVSTTPTSPVRPAKRFKSGETETGAHPANPEKPPKTATCIEEEVNVVMKGSVSTPLRVSTPASHALSSPTTPASSVTTPTSSTMHHGRTMNTNSPVAPIGQAAAPAYHSYGAWSHPAAWPTHNPAPYIPYSEYFSTGGVTPPRFPARMTGMVPDSAGSHPPMRATPERAVQKGAPTPSRTVPRQGSSTVKVAVARTAPSQTTTERTTSEPSTATEAAEKTAETSPSVAATENTSEGAANSSLSRESAAVTTTETSTKTASEGAAHLSPPGDNQTGTTAETATKTASEGTADSSPSRDCQAAGTAEKGEPLAELQARETSIHREDPDQSSFPSQSGRG